MTIFAPLSAENTAVLAALLIPALLVEPVRRIGLRYNLIDRPARHRAFSPKRYVPYLGGILVTAGSLVPALAITGRLDLRLTAVVAGATTVGLLGLMRDLRGFRLPLGAATQATMAFTVAISGLRLRLIEHDWLDLALTVLWVLGVANAFRLLDRVDGMLPVLSCATAAPLAAAALVTDQIDLAFLLVCFAAANCGFLAHNAPPARIAMGESGRLFVGFLIAASAVLVHNGHAAFDGLPILMLVTSLAAVNAVVAVVTEQGWAWTDDGPQFNRLGFALGPNLLLLITFIGAAGASLLSALVAAGVLPAFNTVTGALLAGLALIVLLLQKPLPPPPPSLPRITERHVMSPARTLVRGGTQR